MLCFLLKMQSPDSIVGEDNASVRTTDIAVFHELCNRERVDLKLPYNRSKHVIDRNDDRISLKSKNDLNIDVPPEFLPKQRNDGGDNPNDNILDIISKDESHDTEDKLSVISSVPFKRRSDIESQRSLKSQNKFTGHAPPQTFYNKPNVVEREEDAVMDKAALLQEIKQLQMLNPQTCILSREFTMGDSYETIQLGLYQAKQSIDIASGVNTMKDVLKVGCTGIELGCNKFAKNYVDLNGWSTEVAGSIDGQSYNAPLQQIYRKYWRNGTNGMNPFLQLAFLLLGSAGIFGLKKKFLGTGHSTNNQSAPPMPQTKVAYESQAAPPMPHNTPKMKRPSAAPIDIPQTDSPSKNNLKFTNFKPPSTPSAPSSTVSPPLPSRNPQAINNLLTPGMLDPQTITQTMAAVAPLMKTVGPMLPTMMSAMSSMA